MSDKMSEEVAHISDIQNQDYGEDRLELTAYQHTLLRNCWRLKEEEYSLLNANYFLEATVDEFLSVCDENHPYLLRVEYRNKLYEVNFLHTSLRQLEEFPKETNLIISVREIDELSLFFMLVRLKRTDGKEVGKKVSRLVKS